jgi:hypothetical protein
LPPKPPPIRPVEDCDGKQAPVAEGRRATVAFGKAISTVPPGTPARDCFSGETTKVPGRFHAEEKHRRNRKSEAPSPFFH